MKILLCSPFVGIIGGISLWTNHILTYFEKTDSDISLDFVDCGRKSDIQPNTKIHTRVYLGVREYKEILLNIKGKLQKTKFDALHLVSSGSFSLFKDYLILKWAKEKKIKTVLHFHFGRIPTIFSTRNWEYRVIKKVLAKADSIVVIDPVSFQILKNEGYKNVYFLPNPLSPNVVDIIKNNPEIERQPNKILFVGHAIITKGIFELMSATKDINGIEVHIIGPIPVEVENQLKLQIDDEENKYFLVGVKNHEKVIKEMLSSRIFVLPSYTEGFPNVILESMASGCCIVATDVGAIPEMLDAASERPCGHIIEPKNAEQLKENILKIFRNKEESDQMAINAQKKVNEKYQIDSVAEQLINIWKQFQA